MSSGAEAPTAPKDQERKACGSCHHVGTKVVWRSHKGILESVVLMTCPEMKGLLMRAARGVPPNPPDLQRGLP